LVNIQEELKAAFIHVVSNEWLTNLFSLRKIDRTSACDYIAQSPYHTTRGWDLPERTVPQASPDDGNDGPNFYEYYIEGDRRSNTAARQRLVDHGQDDNDRLVQRFADIFNDVLHYFNLLSTRYALGTDSTDDEDDDTYCNYDGYENPQFSTRPDLVLLGEDDRHLPRELASYSRRMSDNPEGRRDLYRGCVAIGKVEKVQRRGECDKKLEKLANCARYGAFSFLGGF